MKEEIRAYLRSNHAGGDVDDLNDDESLLDADVIDSVVMVGLLEFLQQNYGIAIADEDMMPEHFDTIDAMAEYVGSRQAGLGVRG